MTLEVTTGTATASAEVHVPQASPSGWMAWYRTDTNTYFNQVYPLTEHYTNRDYYQTPMPLFETREQAIQAAQHNLNGRGGELRLVKITL